MKTFKILMLAVISGLVITACSVEQTVNFDKNMKGNMSFQVDMKDMLRELKNLQPDSTKTDIDLMKETKVSESIMQLKDEFEKTDGISNFKALENYEDGILGFSFDFESIENINKGLEEGSKEKKAENVNLFTLGKNKLSIDFGDEKDDEQEDNPMAGFDMGEYILTLNFPFPVKSVNNNLYTLSKDRKQVQLNIELADMVKDFSKLKADIAW